MVELVQTQKLAEGSCLFIGQLTLAFSSNIDFSQRYLRSQVESSLGLTHTVWPDRNTM